MPAVGRSVVKGRGGGFLGGAEAAERSGRSGGGDRIGGVQSRPRVQEWGVDPAEADGVHAQPCGAAEAPTAPICATSYKEPGRVRGFRR